MKKFKVQSLNLQDEVLEEWVVEAEEVEIDGQMALDVDNAQLGIPEGEDMPFPVGHNRYVWKEIE